MSNTAELLNISSHYVENRKYVCDAPYDSSQSCEKDSAFVSHQDKFFFKQKPTTTPQQVSVHPVLLDSSLRNACLEGKNCKQIASVSINIHICIVTIIHPL